MVSTATFANTASGLSATTNGGRLGSLEDSSASSDSFPFGSVPSDADVDDSSEVTSPSPPAVLAVSAKVRMKDVGLFNKREVFFFVVEFRKRVVFTNGWVVIKVRD